jgi:predicted Zn-dependent protease
MNYNLVLFITYERRFPLIKVEARLHKSLTKKDANNIVNARDTITSLYPRLFELSTKNDAIDLENFSQSVKNLCGPIPRKFVIAEKVLEHLMDVGTSRITGLFTNVVFFSITDNLFPIVAYGYDLDKQVGSFIIGVDALRDPSAPVFVKRIVVNTVHAIGMVIVHTRCDTPRCPLNYHIALEEMDNSDVFYCKSCLQKIKAS